jgi:N-methylhydantoinase A
VTTSTDFDFAGVGATIDALDKRLSAFEATLPDDVRGTARRRYFVEARYAYQVWDLSIPLEGEGVADEAALAELVASFHDAHERVFAVREPGQRIDMSQWKGRVVVATAKSPPAATMTSPHAREPLRRRAFFPETGEVDVEVHRGEELTPGAAVEGPALIVEPETTIVVYPGCTARVSARGNYRVDVR